MGTVGTPDRPQRRYVIQGAMYVVCWALWLAALGLLIAATLGCWQCCGWAGTYSGGSGTSGDPYQIGTAADWLELIDTSADWASGKYFILSADVTLGTVTGTVGTNATKFQGVFNGNKKTLSGARMDLAQDIVGLWGRTQSPGRIYDVTASDISIKGNRYVGMIGIIGITSGSEVFSGIRILDSTFESTRTAQATMGALGGLITYCTLSDIYISGCVINCTDAVGADPSYVGGVGGDVRVAAENVAVVNTTINNSLGHWVGGLFGVKSGNTTACRSNATINSNNRCGGLVGVSNAGIMSECMFSGTLNAGTNYYIGGISGEHRTSSIVNCYNIGTINYTLNDATAQRTTAGVVGCNVTGYVHDVTDCYNAGELVPDEYSGQVSHVVGFVQSTSSTVNRCYADVDVNPNVSVRNTEATIGDVTHTTTIHMKRKATYTGWDDTIWTWESDLRGGYPVLLWEVTQTPDWERTCTPTPTYTPHCTPGEIKFTTTASGATCWYCVPAGWWGRLRLWEW